MRRTVLVLLISLVGVDADRAEESRWSLRLEPMVVAAHGHDQHVLTVHEIDLDPPTRDTATAVTLDTESGLAYRFEVRYDRGEWGLGLDFFWFDTTQGRPSRRASAGGTGGLEEVVFEAADRAYSSAGPGEVLFFNVLEDTDIATWTVDLYGTKGLIEGSRSLELQFGLRNADFDNDYHAAVGIDGVAGSLIDASSNYGRMMGPLIGLSGEVPLGKSTLRVHLGQSVVLGSAELSRTIADFDGPLVDPPSILAEESFHDDQDVAIPITELRIGWLYPVTRRISLGAAANVSTWWDVPVPPGVVPFAGDKFHENTISYVGVGVAAKFEF